MSMQDVSNELAPVVDVEEQQYAQAKRRESIAKWALPIIMLVLAIGLWDRVVVWNEIPHYILPRPGLVAQTLINDWAMLSDALWVTLKITLMALGVAVLGGVGLTY